MERWSGVLKVSLNPNNGVYFKIAASLCFSPSSNTLTVPSANAIFFNGDRVEGTGNPVIEKLSNTQNIADVLVSKLGVSVNAWVIEASTYNGPFAMYKEFFHSVGSWGEPKSYDPNGFPASTVTSLLLSRCFEEAKKVISGAEQEPSQAGLPPSCYDQPKTILLGFSKGGTVLNQLVTELAHSSLNVAGKQVVGKPGEGNDLEHQKENQVIVPVSKENLLNSISEIHYVDVGLNSTGAYLTNASVIQSIVERVAQGHSDTRFILHGTPRQWCDTSRPWIRDEKDKMLQLLEDATHKSKERLQVCSRMYFADEPPSMQMHFEIIERLDLS